MDEERLWRLAHDGEELRDLLGADKAFGGQRVVVMREAEFGRRLYLVVVPRRSLMRAAQVEHRFDAVALHRRPRFRGVELRRAVENAVAHGVQVAVILDDAPIDADQSGEADDRATADLEAALQPRQQPRPNGAAARRV